MKEQRFGDRFLHFTETLIYNLTRFYFFLSVAEAIMCAYSLHEGMDTPLVTFITEQNTTFRDVVGVAVIKFMVENVFQYNQFIFKGKSLLAKRGNNGESENQLGSEIDEP